MASTNAQIAKDKGNNAFKAGNWAEAIGCYSQAIVADRTNPTFPLNRAAAYLKLAKYQDAERDCTTVLSLDPKNVKAFFRRAQARSALERFEEAEKDLLDGLKLEPSNDSIKSELSTVRKRNFELERKTKEKSNQPTPPTLPPVVSTSQQPLTVKRRVRNVPIEIVEPDEPMTGTNHVGTSSDKLEQSTAQPIHPNVGLLTPVQSRPLSSSPEIAIAPAPTQPRPSPSPSRPPPRVGAGIFRADGKYTILRSPNPTPSADSSQSSTSVQSAPTTHFAFSRTWNGLKTPQDRFHLINLISPESLPSLFKNNLAPELLISILQTFLTISTTSSDQNAAILSYMSNIPLIPRFDTISLFFSPKEREIVKSLWDNIDSEKADEHRSLWQALLGE